MKNRLKATYESSGSIETLKTRLKFKSSVGWAANPHNLPKVHPSADHDVHGPEHHSIQWETCKWNEGWAYSKSRRNHVGPGWWMQGYDQNHCPGNEQKLNTVWG